MLPMMGYPGVVGEFAGFFSRTFSWYQFRRFKQYLSDLITERKPMVRGIASRIVEPTDQSSLNRFLTLYEWNREELNRTRLQLLQSERATRWRRDGGGSIDDTLLPKTGKKMPGAGKLWDHSSGRFVHAQSLVTSHYVDEEKDYPVGLRQYYKHGSPEAGRYGFKRKLDLAMELVDECEMLGVAAENYVFDSWYLTQEAYRHIEGYGKGWVSRLKSNRLIWHRKRRMSLSQFRDALPREAFKKVKVLDKRYWAYTRVLYVNKLGKARVIICYDSQELEGDPVYLVTNRLYWEERKVIKFYGLRFRIDSFYKDTKQNLGLGGCQLKSLKGARRYWLLGNTAYNLLKLRICRSKLYRRVHTDKTIGAECRRAFMDLLRNLIQWAYNKADKTPVDKILDVVLR